LLEWADHQFTLNRPDANGVPKREHLEQVERQTGRNLKELEPPTEFPSLLVNVWSAFCNLGNARSQGFSGPNPIGYGDIKDYIELTDEQLSPREVSLIRELDVVYMRAANG